MLPGGSLAIVAAADDDAVPRRLGPLREGGVADLEAEFAQVWDVGAVGQDLGACGHDVVGGDVVADFERNAAFDSLGEGLVYRERLDVRTAQNFNVRRVLNACGRSYHIVVDKELLGHYIRRHFADCSRIGEYARYRGYRGSLGRNEVYLTVLCAAASLKVAVERSQRNTLAVRGLPHADTRTARALQNSRARVNQYRQLAAVRQHIEHLLRAASYRQRNVRVNGLAFKYMRHLAQILQRTVGA